MRPQIPNYINPNKINDSIYRNMAGINPLNIGITISQPIKNNGIQMNMGMLMMCTPYPNNFHYCFYFNGYNNCMGAQQIQPIQPSFK